MMWGEFDVFDSVIEKYMPSRGEGETMASQIVTAVNKIVYKWYNDGDVYDNTYMMEGWCNDLSSYANWLYKNVPETRRILAGIVDVHNEDEYEELLWELSRETLDVSFLVKYDKEKIGTIYDCDGMFKFEELAEDDWEEDDDWY